MGTHKHIHTPVQQMRRPRNKRAPSSSLHNRKGKVLTKIHHIPTTQHYIEHLGDLGASLD